MKRSLLFAGLAALLLHSCQKEDQLLYPVTVSIDTSGFRAGLDFDPNTTNYLYGMTERAIRDHLYGKIRFAVTGSKTKMTLVDSDADYRIRLVSFYTKEVVRLDSAEEQCRTCWQQMFCDPDMYYFRLSAVSCSIHFELKEKANGNVNVIAPDTAYAYDYLTDSAPTDESGHPLDSLPCHQYRREPGLKEGFEKVLWNYSWGCYNWTKKIILDRQQK